MLASAAAAALAWAQLPQCGCSTSAAGAAGCTWGCASPTWAGCGQSRIWMHTQGGKECARVASLGWPACCCQRGSENHCTHPTRACLQPRHCRRHPPPAACRTGGSFGCWVCASLLRATCACGEQTGGRSTWEVRPRPLHAHPSRAMLRAAACASQGSAACCCLSSETSCRGGIAGMRGAAPSALSSSTALPRAQWRCAMSARSCSARCACQRCASQQITARQECKHVCVPLCRRLTIATVCVLLLAEEMQGAMRVADVHCATCGARIGWKFCQDLTFQEENCNQV